MTVVSIPHICIIAFHWAPQQSTNLSGHLHINDYLKPARLCDLLVKIAEKQPHCLRRTGLKARLGIVEKCKPSLMTTREQITETIAKLVALSWPLQASNQDYINLTIERVVEIS